MYTRTAYLERIRPFLGKPVVKAITGMRRVGKSYLLRQVVGLLQQDGVAPERILYIDKESLDFEHVKTYRDLNRIALEAFAEQPSPCYLVVDEVQEIEEWERAIASLSGRGDIDILISGSNAHLLSSELATLLSGRYVEFPVYSLGFTEHLVFQGDGVQDRKSEFQNFLRFGGMPATYHFERDADVIYQYIGSTMSAKSIADYLKSQRLRVGVDTVQNYLGYFTEALVAHKVQRYDIKGKRLLDIHEKYYLNDIGIRHALIGFREADINGLLENLVFLELKRRGYGVSIGKLGDREIDFIATRGKEKIYLQVSYLLAAQETIDREFGVLQDIPDNYPKYVLSLDEFFGGDVEGIHCLNLVEFLESDA